MAARRDVVERVRRALSVEPLDRVPLWEALKNEALYRHFAPGVPFPECAAIACERLGTRVHLTPGPVLNADPDPHRIAGCLAADPCSGGQAGQSKRNAIMALGADRPATGREVQARPGGWCT